MNKSNGYLIFLTLVATLGGLLFGYDTAVISGTVKYLDLNFVVPLGLDETAASSLLGFAVSSALIGCVIGGLIGGVMATRLGRKRSLMGGRRPFYRFGRRVGLSRNGIRRRRSARVSAPFHRLPDHRRYRGGAGFDAVADVHCRNGAGRPAGAAWFRGTSSPLFSECW